MAKHCEYVQQLKHMKININEIESIIERHRTIKEWAYIIHDKDVDANGNPIEPHIHLYLNFGRSGAAFETVAKWFKDETQYVDRVKGRKGDILMYLTHQNAPNKHHYSIDEVKSNFDIEQAIAEDKQINSLIEQTEEIVYSFMREEITYSQANKQIEEIEKVCKSKQLADAIFSTTERVEKIWKQRCKILTKRGRNMKIIFILFTEI